MSISPSPGPGQGICGKSLISLKFPNKWRGASTIGHISIGIFDSNAICPPHHGASSSGFGSWVAKQSQGQSNWPSGYGPSSSYQLCWLRINRQLMFIRLLSCFQQPQGHLNQPNHPKHLYGNSLFIRNPETRMVGDFFKLTKIPRKCQNALNLRFADFALTFILYFAEIKV